MQTLNEIISDLTEIARNNNYTGATVDGLVYLMASGIYKNQINVINTAREVSPSTCTLVNSAIQHAQDKKYSVFRGKNQHVIIRYAIPNETKSVKKYDVCTRLGKYKLVYARDYKFESGQRYNGDIELILCEKVIEEKLQSTLRKYTRSNEIDLTEDLDLYIDDEKVDYVNNINIGLSNNAYINQTSDTPYLILTDTDYGVICWCYKANEDILFDTNYKYSIKSVKYLEDTINESSIQSIPGFDIVTTLENTGDKGKGDGIIVLPNLFREDDVNNINIEASAYEHSGSIIRSIDDIKDIFLNYFSIKNIQSCKCYLTKEKQENKTAVKDTINIVYLLQDKNKSLSNEDIKKFKDHLSRAFYVNQDISIRKAVSYRPNNYEPYKAVTKTTKQYTITLKYNADNIQTTLATVVNENDYFTLPNDKFAKSGSRFIGWKFENDVANYALTGKENIPARIIVTKNATLEMVWLPEGNNNYRTVDLYSESEVFGVVRDDNFYQRIVIMKNSEGYYKLDYEPEKPTKEYNLFTSWVNNQNGSATTSLIGISMLSNTSYVASWSSITHSVNFILVNSDIKEQFDLSTESIVKNQNVISGNIIDLSDIYTPKEISDLGYRLTGFYWCDDLSLDNPGDIDKRRKFDVGTPITSDMTLVAVYETDYDLDMTVYFDSPLNNTELHNYVNSYSYNIGETFEPMKIVTQMTKTFNGISWIDLKTSKESIKLPADAYYDFKPNIDFNNEIKEV